MISPLFDWRIPMNRHNNPVKPPLSAFEDFYKYSETGNTFTREKEYFHRL